MSVRTEGLSNADFERLRSLVYREAGINLSPDKKTMMEIRIKRRLNHLRISKFSEYCARIFAPQPGDDELVQLIDVITTNKTDFFRESTHFDYLVSTALPDLAARKGSYRKSLVWSAGCSTGEEPYTLAIVLSEYAEREPGYQFNILASDISTSVLAAAARGIYKSDVLAPVPQGIRRKYFMRSRDPGSNLMRVVPELRDRVEFRRINFMDGDFGIAEPAEMIFCRNVIIYFDRATQVRLLTKLTRHLTPGGYFFAGHSESLQGMDLPLTPVAPAVYRKI